MPANSTEPPCWCLLPVDRLDRLASPVGSAPSTAAVRSLALRCGAAPDIVVRAAIGVVLARWLGESALLVAYPVAPEGPAPVVPVGLVDLADSASFVEVVKGMAVSITASRASVHVVQQELGAATVDAVCDAVEAVLAAAADAPTTPAGRLPLMSGPARDRLVRWGTGKALHLPDRCAHHLIEAQVRARPEGLAVRCGQTRLSYAELWRRSGQIAEVLQRCGVGPDVPVGVRLSRGPALLPVLLGIWRAGGAYLPLAPDDPAARQDLVLRDAAGYGLRVVIADRDAGPPSAAGGRSRRILLVDGDARVVGDAPGMDGTAEPARPHNLAYLMYTSGSTGRPKGVLIEHRNVVALLTGAGAALGVRPGETAVAAAPITFDMSVLELFWPLATGGTVSLEPELRTYDPLVMATALSAGGSRLLQATPSSVDVLPVPDDARLRLLVGGEAIPTRQAEALAARAPQVHAMYGPTETTVWVASARISAELPRTPFVPLGRPFPNTTLLVVDDGDELAPVGMTGELVIGGAQVGRGYLNQPVLNARSFGSGSIGGVHVGRYYRTGDRARWHRDGTLEFLGRADQQVKLRGQRIELGEIEAVLREHARVRDAAVTVRPGRRGDARLLAYVVPEPDGDAPNEQALPDAHVDQWRAVFDEVYAQDTSDRPADLNTSGWLSSYTRTPLPEAQMREWADAAAQMVTDHRPRRVLEVGCGTGLLLFRIARELDWYVGLDVSDEALRCAADRLGQLADRVRLVRMSAGRLMATDFADQLAAALPRASSTARPDCVVLNSVVQYFPSGRYLGGVLSAAARLVDSGGTIVVGDVRSRPLLAAFAASVEMHHRPGRSLGAVRDAASLRAAAEEELVVDPTFFAAWAATQSRPVRVVVRPKTLRHDTEMARFRYDVALVFDGAAPTVGPALWREYADIGGTAEALRAHLVDAATAGAATAVGGIANTLVLPFVGAATRPAQSAAELAATLAGHPDAVLTYDPRNLADGDLAVIWHPRGRPSWPAPLGQPAAVNALTNDPILARAARSLPTAVRSHLRERLPSHLIPAAVIALPSLPTNAHGKVDRALLPVPEPSGEAADHAVSGPEEARIATHMAEVLGVPAVGSSASLVVLGGTSLHAMELLTRLAGEFGAAPGLEQVLGGATVADLADGLRTARWRGRMPTRAGGAGRDESASALQQEIWLAGRSGEPIAYHVPVSLDVAGTLDTDRLFRAVRRTVGRHPALRGVLKRVPGGLAVLHPDSWTVPFDVHEVATERERAAAENALVTKSFVLDADLPVRMAVLRMPHRDQVLMVFHQHAVDPESITAFARELARSYSVGDDAEDADVATGDRLPSTDPNDVEYWRSELSAISPASISWLQRPRAHVRGGVARRDLPVRYEDMARTGMAASADAVTRFVRVLGTFVHAVRDSGGPETIVVGMLSTRRVPGRSAPMGSYLGLLPIVVQCGDTLGSTVARTREVVIGALAHRQIGYRELAGLLPERMGLPATFGLDDDAGRDLRFGDTVARLHYLDPPAAQFMLAATPWISESGRAGISVSFDERRYAPEDVDRLLRRWRALLRESVR